MMKVSRSRFRAFAFLAVAALVVFVFPATAAPATSIGQVGRASDPRMPHAPDHVVVQLREGVQARSVVPGSERVFGRWRTVPVRPRETPMQAVRRLAATPGIAVAELDYVETFDPVDGDAIGESFAATPTDPFYSYQWHFPQIQMPTAWDVSTGAGAVVAVLDSGVSQGGVDLDCHAFVSPYDAVTGTTGVPTDTVGHGTHVTGTVAQCTNNGIGVAGVAYGASIMPVKVGGASGILVSDSAEGIDWARTHGAHVINMSFGGACTAPYPTCTSSIRDAAIAAAASAGIVMVAASGNESAAFVSTPANNPDVLAVGATRFDALRAPYSNYGEGLDVMAPGGDATVDQNGDGYSDGVLQETFDPTWGYYFWQGTSMASPHAAGAAAVLRSAYPSATRQQIMDALRLTALDKGAAGYDTVYGYGLIQVRAALDYLATTPSPSPSPSPSTSPSPSPSPSTSPSPSPSPSTSPSPTPPPVACTISGDSGDNVLQGTAGDDVICAGGGDDVIQDSGGNDTIIGGKGFDTVSYAGAPAAVIVDLAAGTATGGAGTDTIQGVEGVRGTRFDDTINGNGGPNDLIGAGGDDLLWGGGKADRLYGGKGADELLGARGSDDLYGQGGPDDLRGGGGSDDLFGGPGRDRCWQDAGRGRYSSCEVER